jgi:hypothetical protein
MRTLFRVLCCNKKKTAWNIYNVRMLYTAGGSMTCPTVAHWRVLRTSDTAAQSGSATRQALISLEKRTFINRLTED